MLFSFSAFSQHIFFHVCSIWGSKRLRKPLPEARRKKDPIRIPFLRFFGYFGLPKWRLVWTKSQGGVIFVDTFFKHFRQLVADLIFLVRGGAPDPIFEYFQKIFAGFRPEFLFYFLNFPGNSRKWKSDEYTAPADVYTAPADVL